MKIFLDTEFTSFENPQLISLGLVDDNNRTFYAEFNDYEPEKCSQFVNEIVIPLLDKCPNTIIGNSEKIFNELKEWLKEYDLIELMIDYLGDYYFIQNLIIDTKIPSEVWIFQPDEFYEIECRRENGYPAHHALYDAIVNKYAFTEKLN